MLNRLKWTLVRIVYFLITTLEIIWIVGGFFALLVFMSLLISFSWVVDTTILKITGICFVISLVYVPSIWIGMALGLDESNWIEKKLGIPKPA